MLTHGLKTGRSRAAVRAAAGLTQRHRRAMASSAVSPSSMPEPEPQPELCHAPSLPANSPGPLYVRLGKQAVGVVTGALRMQRPWLKKIFRNTSIVDRPVAAYRDYELDETDIVVSTNPKCGTNLMLQTMFQIAWLGKGEFEHIHNVVPEPDRNDKFSPDAITLKDFRNESVLKPSPTGYRVIKTHWSLQDYELIHDGKELPRAKFVTSFRDPKEAFVSGHAMVAEMNNWSKQPGGGFTMQDWLDHLFDEEYDARQWNNARDFVRHDAGVWARRDVDNVHFVRFADIVRDPDAVVRDLASFLAVELTPEQESEVARKISFGYMKENAHKFSLVPLHATQDKGATIVRAGKARQSGEALTPEQANFIDERMQEMFYKADPSFPYAKLYLE